MEADDYMYAAVLSLLAAFFLSIHMILTRKGLNKVDPFKGTFVSIIIALPILTFFSFVMGDLLYLSMLDQESTVYLALAGILHFTVGRTLAYSSNKIVGASRAGALSSAKVVSVTVFGAFLLHETIGINLVFGVIFIFIGTLLILLSTVPLETLDIDKKYTFKGIVFGLVSGVIWGLTPILARVGVLGVKSPLLSNLISYVFAALSYPALLIGTGQHRNFRKIDRQCFGYLIVSGIAVSMGQIFRYQALFLANASFVTPIISVSPLFILFLSYFLIQKIERINLKTVLGVILTLLGVYVIILV